MEHSKRKPGRKKPPELLRVYPVQVALTSDEFTAWQRRATVENRSLSETVRSAMQRRLREPVE